LPEKPPTVPATKSFQPSAMMNVVICSLMKEEVRMMIAEEKGFN
jgi:hypothetical protein